MTCVYRGGAAIFCLLDLAWRLSCVGVFSVVVIVSYTFQNGEFCKILGKTVKFVVMFLCFSMDIDVIHDLAKFQPRMTKINGIFRHF